VRVLTLKEPSAQSFRWWTPRRHST
jgi:hypothetical protein